MTSSFAPRGAAALSLTMLAGCSALAGVESSIRVTRPDPAVLRVKAEEPVGIEVRVFNRGPLDVEYQRVAGRVGKLVRGQLPANGDELYWSVTTTQIEMVLSLREGETTLDCEIRCDGPAKITVDHGR